MNPEGEAQDTDFPIGLTDQAVDQTHNQKFLVYFFDSKDHCDDSLDRLIFEFYFLFLLTSSFNLQINEIQNLASRKCSSFCA